MKGEFSSKKLGISIIIITCVLVAAIIAALVIWHFVSGSKSDFTIQLSSTVGDKMYRGGAGEIQAIKKYSDGRVENGEFTFASDHGALQFPNDKNGAFAIESDERSFDKMIEERGDVATVTVSCAQGSKTVFQTISIKLTPAIIHNITFVYPDVKNLGSSMLQSNQSVYEGYAFDQTKFSDADVGINLDDYQVLWYLQDTNEVFNVSNNFVYQTDIVVTAKVAIKGNIVLKDELHNEEINLPQGSVFYGEPLPANISDAFDEMSDSNGWTFAGWYPDVSKDELENGLDKGKFVSPSRTLYAKWTGTINFNVPDIKPTNKGTLSDEVLCKDLPVTYGAPIADKSRIEDMQYDKNGIHEGWFSGLNGSGQKLDISQNYIGTTGATYYNCVSFPIQLNGQDNENYAAIRQVYGQSLKYTNDNKLVSGENNLPFPIANYSGWEFSGAWTFTQGGDDRFDATQIYNDQIKTGTLTLYAQRTSTYTFYTEIDESGAPFAQAKEVTQYVIYNSKADFSGLEGGAWTFGGWYVFDGNCNQMFDDKEPIVEKDFCTEPNLKLRARWDGKAKFEVESVLGQIIQKSDVDIVYNGSVICPNVDYNDKNNVSFGGWYTKIYGEGEKLDSNKYTFSNPNPTLYAMSLIKVYFNDTLNNNAELTPVTVVYGSTLKRTKEILKDTDVSIGNIPALNDNDRIWRHIGWNYIGADNANLEVVTDEQYTYAEYLSDMKYVYSPSSPQFAGSITLNSIWKVDVIYDTQIGEIKKAVDAVNLRYGDVLEFSYPQVDSWRVKGWFDGKDYKNQVDKVGDETQTRIMSDSEEFKTILNKATNGTLTLYAQWGTNVQLQFGNGNGNRNVDVIYGQSLGQKLPIDEVEIGTREGYTHPTQNNAWKTEYGVSVDSGTTYFPLKMDSLIYQWVGNKYFIVFDYNNPVNGGKIDNVYTSEERIVAVYGQFLKNMPNYVPVTVGYVFMGFTDENNKKYYDGDMLGCNVWDKILQNDETTITLIAQWVEGCAITLDPVIEYDSSYADEEGTKHIAVKAGEPLPANQKAPVRAGYDFQGYYDNANYTGTAFYDSNMICLRNWTSTAKSATLYAKWEKKEITAKFAVNKFSKISTDPNAQMPNPNTHKSDIIIDNGSGKYDCIIISTNHPGVTVSLSLIDNSIWWVFVTAKNKDKSGTVEVQVTDIRTDKTASCKLTYTTQESPCIATGSLITLADGRQVPVETLKGDEQLLVWNLYTGTFDSAPIIFIDSEERMTCRIINLYFSDGTSVKVIFEHAFWDYDLNEWTFLREDAEQYVGHWFNKQTEDVFGNKVNAKVQLVDVVLTYEKTIAWSPVTYGHLCYYVNGMLSMPGATEGFINIFDVDPQTMKIDETKMVADIQKYGLFTYEDFAEYIPKDVFCAFNGQYLKVAIGKGLLTWDDIFALIDRYSQFWQ